jgi:hypothetical protein
MRRDAGAPGGAQYTPRIATRIVRARFPQE